MFEFKVLQFAGGLATRFGGKREPASFLMALDTDGSLLTLSFDPPQDGWSKWMERMKASEMSYLFLDPFDPFEYTWLEWHRIPQTLMERMMEKPFEPADFDSIMTKDNRGRLPYPETWGVMF